MENGIVWFVVRLLNEWMRKEDVQDDAVLVVIVYDAKLNEKRAEWKIIEIN